MDTLLAVWRMCLKKGSSIDYRLLGWVVALSILLNGCATLHLPKYEPQSFDHYLCSQVKDGLAVAIHPLTDRREIRKYFGIDLLSAHILAVFVVAENRSSSLSFILSKDQFSLGAKQIETGFTSGFDQLTSESGSDAVSILGAIFIAPALILFGAKMDSDAAEINYNFAVKELQTKTLSPKEVTHGFVYFRLPDEYNVNDQWTVHLEAFDLRNKDSKSFNIPFEWERD